MAKFRKKPVVIEAMQFKEVEPRRSNAEGIVNWIGDNGGKAFVSNGFIFVWTLESHNDSLRADEGDWIIKGVKGEFYPIKNDIFLATYEPCESDRENQ